MRKEENTILLIHCASQNEINDSYEVTERRKCGICEMCSHLLEYALAGMSTNVLHNKKRKSTKLSEINLVSSHLISV